MRYFLELSYNGANYHGWQIQPNSISIQSVLDAALSTLCAAPTFSLGCGRTDAGVHAKQFYAHFDTDKALNEDHIVNLNGMLPYDIAIKKIIQVHDDAHARFDASLRSYEYHMHFKKDPFLKHLSYYYQYKRSFNIDLMNECAAYLLSQNDFASFCKSNSNANTTFCKITEAKWVKPDEHSMVFHISADRFLRNMVRAIVGTLIDVGVGKISAEDFKNIVANKNRSDAGTSVPANGLYLTRVIYPFITENEHVKS